MKYGKLHILIVNNMTSPFYIQSAITITVWEYLKNGQRKNIDFCY